MGRLSREEKRIAKSYARGEWRAVKYPKGELRRYHSYARDAIQKSSRVNIRISPRDLEGVQQRALQEGIPYQTLMTSIIHKYVSGRLMERRV